jgi:16S rRNA (cytidine1402-2'-O)-methyltransferase
MGPEAATNEKISARIARMQAEAPDDEPLDENQALKRLARELGQSKSDLYRELQRERARRH